MTLKNRRCYQAVLAVALGALTFTQAGSLLSARSGTGLSFGLSSGLLPAAHAQEFTDTDVANYASAVLEIEASRTQAYEAAGDILLTATEGAVDILETTLSCQAAKMSDMPDISKSAKAELQETVVAFCQSARDTAEDNQLTAKRFNSLTAAHREDTDLAERIQTAIAEQLAPAAPAESSDEPAEEE